MSIIDITFAGRIFQFEDMNGKDLVAKAMLDGSFEAPLPILIMAMIDRLPGSFIDVGANSGLYTVLAGVTRQDVQIHSFEPFPAALEICTNNVRHNQLQNRVTIHQVALSDHSGSAQLFIPDQSHGLLESSCSLEETFKGGVQTSIEVPIRTLDEFAIPEKITVIKADIEGHEHAFLAGASVTIKKNRPVIFAEVLPPANFGALQSFIRQNGYVDFRLRADMAICDEVVRFDGMAWNHAFVPAEKVEIFHHACQTHSIELTRRMVLA